MFHCGPSSSSSPVERVPVLHELVEEQELDVRLPGGHGPGVGAQLGALPQEHRHDRAAAVTDHSGE